MNADRLMLIRSVQPGIGCALTHGREERQDVQCGHGARLPLADPDEDQEDQQQDEREVEAHRHAEQRDGSHAAGDEFGLSLLLSVGHSA